MNWFMKWWNKFRMEMRYRKRIKELRKRDPFIYK